MQFRIADTFTASLARLSNEQQKAAKTTAFGLQLNPAQPGLGLHRVTGAKDRNCWPVGVDLDSRIIFHRAGDGMTLCYVGHHAAAYGWAERRQPGTHPTTGAAQLVELRDKVEAIKEELNEMRRRLNRLAPTVGVSPRGAAGAVREEGKGGGRRAVRQLRRGWFWMGGSG